MNAGPTTVFTIPQNGSASVNCPTKRCVHLVGSTRNQIIKQLLIQLALAKRAFADTDQINKVSAGGHNPAGRTWRYSLPLLKAEDNPRRDPPIVLRLASEPRHQVVALNDPPADSLLDFRV